MSLEEANRALREGIALLEVGRAEEALGRLGAAVAENPEDAEAHCHLARALSLLGRSPDALEAATAGATLAPGWEWPHRLRSHALLELGRTQEAVAAGEEAVRLEPEFGPCHEALADALIADRQYWTGFHVAERARQLEPDDSGPWETMANALAAIERWDEAIECFKGALERDPENPMAHNNLGCAYLGKNDKTRAKEAFERAVRLDPAEPLFRENLALASRIRANPQWLLYVFLAAGFVTLSLTADSDSAGETALAVVAILAAVLSIWWITFTVRTRNASAGERDLLKRQSFFERFDFSGWTPWPFLIPSPFWFAGSTIVLVAAILEMLRERTWDDSFTWAFLLILLLIAVFSAGRSRLYLTRTGHWPPWEGWR